MYHQNIFKVTLFFVLICWGVSKPIFGQKRLETAEIEMTKKAYASALETFLMYWENNSESASILEKIVECQLNLKQFEVALANVRKLKRMANSNENIERMYLDLLVANEMYDELKSNLSTKIVNGEQRNEEYQKLLSRVQFAEQNKKFNLVNLSTINTEFDELSPTLYNSKLVFCSNREGTIIKQKSKVCFGFNYDFYSIPILLLEAKSNIAKELKLFSAHLNSNMNETSICFNKAQDTVYVSRNQDGKPIKLYQSNKIKTKDWGTTQYFILNDSLASFTQPSISGDGKLFFFSSDMKRGYGGSDIYVCIKIDSSWSMPINLGPQINTLANEIYPYYHNDTLYFSSNSYKGIGGYDIYQSTFDGTNWSEAIGLGRPFNSGADDFGLAQDEQGVYYISSNRVGGKGGDDIYKIEPIK